MEDNFVPYEQALALKELGFDEPCFGHWNYNDAEINYWNNTEMQNERTNRWFSDFETQFPLANKNGCTAPLYQQAFEWFRDKHNLMFQIFYLLNGNHAAVIHKTTPEYMDLVDQLEPSAGCIAEVVDCYSYKEAELECLKKLIEVCQQEPYSSASTRTST